MGFTQTEINEFRTEAFELLADAESALLAIDTGASYATHYDAMFRAFHSVKGAAGMMEMTELQAFVHHLETSLVSVKSNPNLTKSQVEYFLNGCDSTKALLSGESSVSIPHFPGHPDQDSEQQSDQHLDQKNSVPLALTPEQTLGRIVVIDDDASLAETVAEVLTSARFDVVTFTDAKQAIRYIVNNDVDAVFTDFKMPTLDGGEILTLVKRIDSQLPVVFVTGECSRENLIKSINAGVYFVIEKPWRIQTLSEIARKATHTRRLNQLVDDSLSVLMAHYPILEKHLRATSRENEREKLNADVLRILDRKRSLRKPAHASKS